jgi:hypothetical protein
VEEAFQQSAKCILNNVDKKNIIMNENVSSLLKKKGTQLKRPNEYNQSGWIGNCSC